MALKVVLLLTLFSYIAFGGAVAEEQEELIQAAPATYENQAGLSHLFRGLDNIQQDFAIPALHRVERATRPKVKTGRSKAECRRYTSGRCVYSSGGCRYSYNKGQTDGVACGPAK